MKRLFLIATVMIAYLNLNARVTLGKVKLDNVSNFEISESITETGSTAKITIPKNYTLRNGMPVLKQFKAGDPVTVECGYNGEYATEYQGYITEIESDIPLVIHCDNMYLLKQNSFIKSYPEATVLKTVLTDILEGTGITSVCDDVVTGKYLIDNVSTFAVLHDLVSTFGLYSRLNLTDKTLKAGLAYAYGKNTRTHSYVIGKNVKQNSLKYRRADDIKVRAEVTSKSGNGEIIKAAAGASGGDANLKQLNLPSGFTKSELQELADNMYQKTCYDGYTGSITGFGYPRTRAGDALTVIDDLEPDNEYRNGTYLIEKVNIVYGNGGFSRENTLSYKI